MHVTTYRSAMSCEKDSGFHKDNVATSFYFFDATIRTTEDLMLESNMARDIPHSKSSSSPLLKPKHQNVSKVFRKMASADQQDSYKQSNTLPSQPSAAHWPTPKDQCGFDI